MTINRTALERLKSIGGLNLLSRMVDLFRQNVLNRFDEISNGMDKSDNQEVIRGFHSIKSSAGNVGAEKLQAMAAAGEKHAVEWDQYTLQTHLDEMKSEYESVSIELEQYRGGGTL